MSINVDKMDSKYGNSTQKSKPVLKRRKKNSSLSELSNESMSPKKRIVNGYGDEYLSSSDITYSSSLHRILPAHGNGPASTANGRVTYITPKSPDHPSEFNGSDQYGSARSVDSQSPRHSLGQHYDDSDSASSSTTTRRRPRTNEDFYLFCKIILEYENYSEVCNQEALRSSTNSPLDSTGSATESTTSTAPVIDDESNHAISNLNGDEKDLTDTSEIMNDASEMLNDTRTEDLSKTSSAIDVSSTNEEDDPDIDADSYNLITCFCGKPYAARPMIECSKCLTWLHLSCAKVKRKNIPDIFICSKCVKTPGWHLNHGPALQSAHPKDLETSEPKENNRSKKSTATSTPQTRSDKLENNILQPLNVSATFETGANNLDNIKTASAVSSIAVKYK